MALQFLNDYSNAQAQQMLDRWKKLATYLIVKYNDMAVRPDDHGIFRRTQTGLGARVIRPGYPRSFARKLVESTGDKFEVPVVQK